jgi:cytoskeletal protein CcmA (bactofilin family)
LKSSARLFGDVEATNLVIEAGAVFVGAAKIGRALRAPAYAD